jgi:hypothetical protein
MEEVVVEPIVSSEPIAEARPSFSATVFGNEQPAVQEAPVHPTEVPQENQVQSEPVIDEDGVSSFSMPNYGDEPIAEQGMSEDNLAWKEALKQADRKEVLKELGLDDFDIEFSDYRKNGNDPYKYLEAKSFDWEQVPDIDIVIEDFIKQYPTFDSNQLDRLISKKYGYIDGGDEEDNADALILMKADAHLSRQQRIAEQKNFKIPQSPQEAASSKVEQLYAEQQEIAMQNYQQQVNFYKSHEATQNLIQSKRVGVEIGGDKPFYFNVDKPELITKAITDGELWQRITAVNPQEADAAKLIPDVAKLQKLVIAAMNPNYEKDLVNYGKSLGLKNIVEEGQNARKPNGTVPTVSNDSPSMAWGRATQSNFGGRK